MGNAKGGSWLLGKIKSSFLDMLFSYSWFQAIPAPHRHGATWGWLENMLPGSETLNEFVVQYLWLVVSKMLGGIYWIRILFWVAENQLKPLTQQREFIASCIWKMSGLHQAQLDIQVSKWCCSLLFVSLSLYLSLSTLVFLFFFLLCCFILRLPLPDGKWLLASHVPIVLIAHNI